MNHLLKQRKLVYLYGLIVLSIVLWCTYLSALITRD